MAIKGQAEVALSRHVHSLEPSDECACARYTIERRRFVARAREKYTSDISFVDYLGGTTLCCARHLGIEAIGGLLAVPFIPRPFFYDLES